MTLTGGERGGTLGLDTLGEDEEEGGKREERRCFFFGSPRHHKGALNLLQGEEQRRVWGGREEGRKEGKKEGNKEDGGGESEEKVGKEETIV
jgi:hypothetical protein